MDKRDVVLLTKQRKSNWQEASMGGGGGGGGGGGAWFIDEADIQYINYSILKVCHHSERCYNGVVHARSACVQVAPWLPIIRSA